MNRTVYVAIGSNIDPEQSIHNTLNILQNTFGQINLSSVYQTKPVGFIGHDFLNILVCFKTDDCPESLTTKLKSIERQVGGHKPDRCYTSRRCDLDLILYGDLIVFNKTLELPHGDIIKFPFVLAGLVELAPDMPHPLLKQSFKTLWTHYHPSYKSISRVNLSELSLGIESEC